MNGKKSDNDDVDDEQKSTSRANGHHLIASAFFKCSFYWKLSATTTCDEQMRVATTFRSFTIIYSVSYSTESLFACLFPLPIGHCLRSYSVHPHSISVCSCANNWIYIFGPLLLLNDGLISIEFTGKRFAICRFWVGSVLIFHSFTVDNLNVSHTARMRENWYRQQRQEQQKKIEREKNGRAKKEIASEII